MINNTMLERGYLYACFNHTQLDPDTEGYDIVGACQSAYPSYEPLRFRNPDSLFVERGMWDNYEKKKDFIPKRRISNHELFTRGMMHAA